MSDYWTTVRGTRLRRRRLLAGATTAGAGIGGMLLVGCGSSNSSTSNSAASANNAAAASATRQPAASAASGAATSTAGGRGAASPAAQAPAKPSAPVGTLTIAPEGGSPVINTFNPLDVITGYQLPFVRAIADAPQTLDSDGKQHIFQNQLASKVEKSPDGLKVTYTLRPDPKFHDGTPVTAEDVAFSFDYIRSDASKSSRKATWGAVLDKIETPDKQTVVLTLKSVYNFLFTAPYSFSTLSKAAFTAKGPEGFAASPVTAGPWKFVDGTKGVKVHLTAVTDHYRQAPLIKDLNIVVSPEESTRLAQVQTGEVDITYISSVSKAAAKAIQGAKLYTFAEDFPEWIVFRDNAAGVTNSPTNDPRVRLAMSKAVNRKAIIDNLFSGEAVASGSISLPRVLGHNNIAPDAYSLDEAKALLTQAGFGSGFNIDLRINGKSEYVDVMVADWKKIGINVNVIVLDDAGWTALVYDKKTAGMHIQPLKAAIDPANWAAFIPKDVPLNYLPDSVIAKTEPLMSVVDNGPDDNERAKAWNQVQQIIHDDATYCSLWHQNTTMVAGAKVTKWDPIPDVAFILRTEYAQVKA